MSRATFRAGSVIASVVALVAACSIEAVDVANKGCPCGDGYVCDDTRNVCVRPGDLAGIDAGADAEPPACANDQCPCGVDGDCRDLARAHCSPAKVCVECAQNPDSCATGGYCNDKLQCTPGCKQESDCQISPAAPHCDLGRHQCVECTKTADCAGGKLCSPSGACVEGCDVDAGKPCTNGKTCCQNLCIDTTADPLNCGGCGTTCSTVNGTPKCAASACTWTCASGFGHCDPGNTGCETNLRTTATRCGSCAMNCTTSAQHANGVTCSAGSCAFASCALGFGNCDGVNGNGCECACGAAVGDICCPGNLCNFPGGKCSLGNGKCTP